MKVKPIFHKYHFNDIREEIFSKLETILNSDAISYSNEKQYRYICTELYLSKEYVKTCIVLVNDNVVIQNSFPKQLDKNRRLWFIDSFLGRITYIEIDNPNLRNFYKYDIIDPSGNTYEMHAMPNDLIFINNLLKEMLLLINGKKFINRYQLDNDLSNILNIT